MVGWQEWHYCACDEPDDQAAPGVQAVVVDPHKPPRATTSSARSSRSLSRPYPQVVAGTPTEWEFDPEERVFTLAYEKKRASGEGRFRRGLTDVFVPRLHYRDGYRAEAKGARVVSKPGAKHLLLRARRRVEKVSLTVRPR